MVGQTQRPPFAFYREVGSLLMILSYACYCLVIRSQCYVVVAQTLILLADVTVDFTRREQTHHDAVCDIDEDLQINGVPIKRHEIAHEPILLLVTDCLCPAEDTASCKSIAKKSTTSFNLSTSVLMNGATV